MSEEATTRHLRLSEMSKAAEQVRANYYDKSWALVIGINDYQGEHPMLAWDTLSDSFKRNTSGLNRDTSNEHLGSRYTDGERRRSARAMRIGADPIYLQWSAGDDLWTHPIRFNQQPMANSGRAPRSHGSTSAGR